jgi:hypothetical protein
MAKNKSKPLFVDTGYIIALINWNDHFHRQASALSELSFALAFDRHFCTGRFPIRGLEVAL